MVETTTLYGGEIQLEFNPANHQYRVINKGRKFKVPSVTRITSVIDKSGPLMAWAINKTVELCKGAIAPGTEYAEVYLEEVWNAAKKASARIKSEAASKGTEVHQAIETVFRGGSSSLGVVSNLQDWLKANGIRLREVEQRVYSRRGRYSGTLDAIGETETGLLLLDWKTSKSVYPEFRLQTAAYQHAWEEEHPDQPIVGRYIVRILEDESIEPHFYPRSTYRLDFKAFNGAKALFDRIKQIEKSL